MIKTLVPNLLALFLLANTAWATPVKTTPAKRTKTAIASTARTAPVASPFDALEKEIGSGRVLRMTFKDGRSVLVTLQGRTDTQLIASAVHFSTGSYSEGAGGFNHIYPHDLNGSEAIDLLETNPKQYTLEGVHIYSDDPGDKMMIVPENVVRVQWLNLPNVTPRPAKIVPKPTRINPSLYALWP